MLGLIVAAVTLLEWGYSQSPVPPGVDPAHWIDRAGAYVGLPVPPVASFGGPYIYPPLVFPLLGGLRLLFGSPLAAGFAAGAILLALFGLSIIFVAFRFIRYGPLQFAFVGACLFSGTLLYMLMWGAYPNFFAFVFLNLTFVFLLAFTKEGSWQTGLLLGATLSLLYLAHDLTFAIGLVTVLVAAVLVLTAAGPRFLWSRIRNLGFLAGVGLLIGTYGFYNLALRLTSVTPPDYLSSNPAALIIDNVGEIFTPLAPGPLFTPAGSVFYMAPRDAEILLFGVAGALFLAHLVVHRIRPRWLTLRHTIAVAALMVALVTPAAGALARIGTDYPRFIYFFPVPIALVVAVVLDVPLMRWLEERARRRQEAMAPEPGVRRPIRVSVWPGYVAAGVVLTLLFVNVSVPTVQSGETTDTGITHTNEFLSAVNWIGQNPTPGSVLTIQGAARWVQALTQRGTYDEGPTWLDFEQFEIVNAQLSYWALNSAYAVTDDNSVLSYTPPNSPLLSQTPMYSVWDEGIAFPVLRVLPGALSVSYHDGAGNATLLGSAWGPGQLTVDPTTGFGTIQYSTPAFNATISGALGTPGTATLSLSISAAPGTTLLGVTLPLGSPPPGVLLLKAPNTQTVYPTSTGFLWNSTGTLGQLPSPWSISTTGTVAPAPTSESVSTFPINATLDLNYALPSAPTSFSASVTVSTPGTGNPGVALPRVMSTSQFLDANDVAFLLMPTTSVYSPTVGFLQSAFGFTLEYSNDLWAVYQR